MKKLTLLSALFLVFANIAKSQTSGEFQWQLSEEFDGKPWVVFEDPKGFLNVGGEFSSPGSYLAIWDSVMQTFGDNAIDTVPFGQFIFEGQQYITGGTNVTVVDTLNGRQNAITVNGSVGKSYLYEDKVIISGLFTEANGVPVSNIFLYDGDNIFPMGSGTETYVSCIAKYNDTLLVAEGYGGQLKYWNSDIEEFIPFTSALEAGIGITAMAVTEDNILYLGGYIAFTDGPLLTQIVQYKDGVWSTISDDYIWPPAWLFADPNGGVIIPRFPGIDGDTSITIIKYKDGEFISFPDLYGTANDICIWNDQIVLAGLFGTEGGGPEDTHYGVAWLTEIEEDTTIDTTDFVENLLVEKIILYPNPVMNTLHINMDAEEFEGTIFDLNGKTVKSFNKKEIEVANLPSGIYTVMVRSPKSVSRGNFVKQ